MRYGFVAAAVAAVAVAALLTARPVGAMKPFFEQFKAMYVKPNSKDRTMLIFAEAVQAKGCTICHGKSSKKTFNAYGAEVRKLLTKGDINNPTKIRAALVKVSRIKTKADDPKSPTFGERLKQGKLPVGEIHVRPKEKESSGQDAKAGQ